MCTLTWIARDGGYELHFNRDEKLTRAAGVPPRRFERAGRAWIAPTDPDGGGAWIGVNDRGVTLALLNGYRSADSDPGERRSRGLLVQDLLDLEHADELGDRVRAADPGRYRSFVLVAVDRSTHGRAATWDGAELRVDARQAGGPPECSSSLDPTGAARARRELFAQWTRRGALDAETLARFHASHEPERGPLSPCMHRADAQTQSYTRVRVDARQAQLSYSPGAPCLRLPATSVELELARAGGALR